MFDIISLPVKIIMFKAVAIKLLNIKTLSKNNWIDL